jgi:predicted lysophospholipase L1 biosynthesis ABC-type transport system permease subunit
MRAGGYAGESGAGLYRPATVSDVYPARVAVRVREAPAAFAPRLRELAATVDPTLRLHDVVPLDAVYDGVLRWLGFLFWITVVGLSLAVLLALAGIYAVMSFTVARRTREIGIRVALGADRRALVLSIFRRPLQQVAIGVAVGAVVAGAVMFVETGEVATVRSTLVLAAYAATMFGVCLLACIVPTRRALGVEPTEALRADG